MKTHRLQTLLDTLEGRLQPHAPLRGSGYCRPGMMQMRDKHGDGFFQLCRTCLSTLFLFTRVAPVKLTRMTKNLESCSSGSRGKRGPSEMVLLGAGDGDGGAGLGFGFVAVLVHGDD